VSRPLVRVFRLRALLEEASRVELERLAKHASRVEQARERERGMVLACRKEVFSLILEAGSAKVGSGADGGSVRQAANERWFLPAAVGEISAWQERRLEPLAQVAACQLEAGREEFFMRRKERQQVETVLQNAAELRKIEKERRDQKTLDDWFAMTRCRRQRA